MGLTYRVYSKNYPDVVVSTFSVLMMITVMSVMGLNSDKGFIWLKPYTYISIIVENFRRYERQKCFTDENQKEYYAQRKDFLRLCFWQNRM